MTKFDYWIIIDCVLGLQTLGGMMEVANEFTELWRHPFLIVIVWIFKLSEN